MRIPLKARLSHFHQRLFLTLRYWFRLPIDDIRDRERARLDRQFSDALRAQAGIVRELQARLHWYDTRVPLLKKESKAFTRHWKKLMTADEERQQSFTELVQAGVPEHEARMRIWPRRPMLVPKSDSSDVQRRLAGGEK